MPRDRSARRILLPFVSWQYWHGRLMPIFFYKVYLNTLDICLPWLLSHVRSRRLIEGSAPFLRVFFFFGVSIVLGGGSGVVMEYFQSLPRKLAYLSRPISLGVSDLVYGSLSDLPLVWWRFFMGDLDFPSVPYDEINSKILRGTDSLRIGESSPCLLSPSSHDG